MPNYTFIVLILFVIAFLFRVDAIFYVVYVAIGLYGWNWWMVPRVLKKIEVVRHFPRRAFWGETITVRLQIFNPAWFSAAWVQFNESIPFEISLGEKVNHVLSLGGKEKAELSYQVRGTRRGYYRLGPLQLAAGDVFGFLPDQFHRLPAEYLIIYPRLTPYSQLNLPSRLPFGTLSTNQRLFEDPARPVGVREFRSGDSVRQVHWKVTGHTGQLFVKTFQPAMAQSAVIFLNLAEADFKADWISSDQEWAIELAASLAAHWVEVRQAVGLSTNGVDLLESGVQFDEKTGRLLHPPAEVALPPAPAIAPRPGREHLMKILERLARLETTHHTPFIPWLSQATTNLSWGTTLLVITPHADLALCQVLHQQVQRGLNPFLLVTQPQANLPQLRQQARQLGFSAFPASKPAEVQKMG